MATCLSSITTLLAGPGIGSLTIIHPSTLTPIVCSPSVNQLLLAQMDIQQTVTFNITLASSIPGAYNVTLSIYKVVGSVVTSYASITMTTNSVSFTQDFQPGNYIFCFHVNNTASYTGTIIGSFVAIPVAALLFPIVLVGEKSSANLTVPSPPRICSQPMFYSMVGGELPPGVTLDELGFLRGTLPNLDCVEKDQYGYDYSPSFNWFYERSGSSYPLGRQWRFKVRLTLASNTDVFTENWFCIRIFNNWDFDRDNFKKQIPFTHEVTTVIVDPQKVLEPPCEDCPPDPKTKPFVPVKLESQCVPCDSPPETTSVTLIPIPKSLLATPPSQFTLWFSANATKDFSAYPDIQEFVQNLKDSALFNKLLVQNNLEPNTAPTAQELLIATTYQNYLQIAATMLQKDGRNRTDIDAQLLVWQNQENQKNPIFSDVYSGEHIKPFELIVKRIA